MSKTARTSYKTKKEKRKDVRAARAVKNSVSDVAELWIAPNKQFCLKPSYAQPRADSSVDNGSKEFTFIICVVFSIK